ncbi:DNA replication/repair protein RecF [Aestuariirhabdus litorea]|uniref:DNA replication and repair protein RecF n=1 Tax=Aestuariirhabdus litorea TaxID=2528527 RepID=A0A3P3VIP5_9GAMM|nr:DNA replication/repair protein RecF [Aestuariirhabdus litorea]RRJ82611.1 DNA replication/repair protein RecF [Aestuariirhabdus litorea]RWW92770.1 DNA replication/repair protein RecF [Endozoicomonadaceae bacterium GTF-13]
MSLSRIRVLQLRNLAEAQLEPSPRINIILGENGSGKTSLLEAIHLLGTARSFRSTKLKPIIQTGSTDCVVFGELLSQGMPHRLGVKRTIDGGGELKINGIHQRSAATLATTLPVQLITPDSFTLLTGGSKPRRQFIDWGVFHVEHQFLGCWRQYQSALKQRNHLLRHGKIDPSQLLVWNAELARNAEHIDQMRQSYFSLLAPVVRDLVDRFELGLEGEHLSLSYTRGWDAKTPFIDQLDQQVDRDSKLGFTQTGPHRADLSVRIGRDNAVERLSRGQQKLLVCALKLAQARLFRDHSPATNSVFLVDDLAAELDREHRTILCHELVALECQVFVTCIESDTLEGAWPTNAVRKMFHVKHGNIVELAQP